jgi:hypothetical protein
MSKTQSKLAEENREECSPKLIETADPIVFKTGKNIALRLYPDCRPKNLEIAALQKGLVLISGGIELIEEGAGFGTPIAKYSDGTFFSSTAQVSVNHVSEDSAVICKTYFLDAISEKKIRGTQINKSTYSFVHRIFEKGYLTRQGLRPVFDLIMQLRKKMGVHTHFIKVNARGKIAITYHCFPDQIRIHVDMSALNRSLCKEILILNEQGANRFQTYKDAKVGLLKGRAIGAWAKVEAKKASFVDKRTGLTFTLENLNGVTLYRGREEIKDRFSWSGLTYALNPEKYSFDYIVCITQK